MTTVLPAINPLHIAKLAKELNLRPQQIEATAQLLAEGGTVPFIARYRKEATGTLDEVAVTAIRDRLEQLAELDKRRESILSSLEERKLLTDELKKSITEAETLTALEDLYAPFRPKKRTRAMAAKEAGLQPLADLLLAQDPATDPEAEAAKYLNKEHKIETAADALQGARDILAEHVSEHADARAALRDLFWERGVVTSKRIDTSGTIATTDEEKAKLLAALPPETLKFKDYFDWSEPVKSIPSHRLLAIRRGAAEGVLMFRIAPPDADAIAELEAIFLTNNSKAAAQVKQAIADSWKRLLALSMETEIRLESKKRADAAAIEVFATNLRQLLMASPLGQKSTLAIDPGFRTGCKTVVLDAQGKLLHNDVIYPDQGAHKTAEAEHKVRELVAKYGIEAIAIGNGTASRETEQFIKKLNLRASSTQDSGLRTQDSPMPIVMVNESGASIYSASAVAREEFPDHDLTVRGAVSIGRRLQDPLAELVKLDPKSIGVGQYQHDVDQDRLKKSLDDIVVSCVNAVGVELNSASKQLLTYVSGLSESIAENIVNHRNANGPFKTRKDLLNVPRLGPKTFEQAAGFLRIRNAAAVGGATDGKAEGHPLDASAVHPERYALVEHMARDLNVTIMDLMRDENLRKKINLQNYITAEGGGVGLPTLTDILAELAKPGRDPRQQFEAFQFAEGINKIEDLTPGMKLPGIVTNVTAFGAFVDIGVHQDGLVHVSQLADRFVKDPNDVVKVQQRVEVTVLEVDIPRKRISLTMRKAAPAGGGAGGKPTSASANTGSKNQPSRFGTTASSKVPTKPAAQSEGWFSAALKNATNKKGGL
jgi:uncharacterized protein